MNRHDTGWRYTRPSEPLRLRHWLQACAIAAAILFTQGYLDGREELLTARLEAAKAAAKIAVATKETKE